MHLKLSLFLWNVKFLSPTFKARDTFLQPALQILNYFVTFMTVLYTALPAFTVITALPVLIPFTLPLASTVTSTFTFTALLFVLLWAVSLMSPFSCPCANTVAFLVTIYGCWNIWRSFPLLAGSTNLMTFFCFSTVSYDINNSFPEMTAFFVFVIWCREIAAFHTVSSYSIWSLTFSSGLSSRVNLSSFTSIF